MKIYPNHPSFRSLIKIVIGISLTMAFLVSAFPATTAQAKVKCVAYYTVKEGDTTPKIAQTFGLKWGEIANANDMEYPYKLKPGLRLCIPEEGSTEKSKSTTKGTVTVTSRGNLITITASGFSKKGSHYVKVRDVSTAVGGWYKIGKLNVPKKSSVTGYYVLPKQLKGSIYLEVCLKEGTTDEKICRVVLHRYV